MRKQASREFDAKKLDAIFAHLDRCHLPGAAVGVALGGAPVYRKGFGLANMELPVVLGPATMMRIGSMTKHFAALAFLLLCEEGSAHIDDQIGQHVPEIHETSRHVTMRRLMSHTSGIRDVYQISMFTHGMGRTITDAELLECYRRIKDVDFAPGESWSYNNGGYLLVTAAIERITGQSLDEVLARRIFAPLGMYDTRLRRWDSDFQPNSAALHMVDGKGNYTRRTMDMELTGAGGIVSTMDDMLRWLRHMDAPVIGTAGTWNLMRQTQRLANGAHTAYGLGLVVDRYRGVDTVSHAGGVMGGNSQMIKVPSAQLDISIACNRADAMAADFAYRIIDLCVDGLEPCCACGNPLARGTYLSSPSGRVIEVHSRDGSAFVSVDAGMPMPVVPGGDEVWRLAPAFSFVGQTFVPTKGGLRFAEFGREEQCRKIEPPAEAAFCPPEGVYRAAAIDVDAQVFPESGHARLRMQGRYGEVEYELTPLTERIWKARSRDPLLPLAGILAFAADGGEFVLTADRMRQIRFRRARR